MAQTTQDVIVYLRRSTNRGQKHTLESQEMYIRDFCRNNDLHIVAIYSETYTGNTMNRPAFMEALNHTRRAKIPLVVKSISRLGRDAASVIELLNKNQVIVAECGLECEDLMLKLLAVLNQNEREIISHRTKLGLNTARKKGITLGNPKIQECRKKGLQKIQEGADAYALSLRELFDLNENLSLREQARRLNRWGVPTRRGQKWTAQSVRNLRKRLKLLEEKM